MSVPLSKSPTYPGYDLARVCCTLNNGSFRASLSCTCDKNSTLKTQADSINEICKSFPFSKYKFSEKLRFLSSWYAHVRTCAYLEARNLSFSENFAYVLNKWPLSNTELVLPFLTLEHIRRSSAHYRHRNEKEHLQNYRDNSFRFNLWYLLNNPGIISLS